MSSLSPRWYLFGTSTNPHGVTHFTITCRGDIPDDDYEELLRVLKRKFAAVEDEKLVGPYSIHQYMKVDNIRVGIVIDEPDWLSLYATEAVNVEQLRSFIARLLDSLNARERESIAPTQPQPDDPVDAGA